MRGTRQQPCGVGTVLTYRRGLIVTISILVQRPMRRSWLLAHAAAPPSARILIPATAAVLAAANPAPASGDEAQTPHRVIAQICRTHTEIETKLLGTFGEKKLGHGISADGSLIELFAAPGGTFSVVKTSPGGTSCIVDFGEIWQVLNPLEAARFPQDRRDSTPF